MGRHLPYIDISLIKKPRLAQGARPYKAKIAIHREVDQGNQFSPKPPRQSGVHLEAAEEHIECTDMQIRWPDEQRMKQMRALLA